MDKEQKKAHKEKMRKKYGSGLIKLVKTLNEKRFMEYKIICDAVTWLRFWSERGHSMVAWY